MISALERTPELPKYELIERIGTGGMATVYRARDRRLGREVAVKLIHAHLRENSEVAARFVSEARAVARLRHPNVVEVYDVSDEDEVERYLVVELVSGMTLRAVLQKHKVLPPELAAGFALEVAGALSHAHGQGIIHRDVKPENVLVDMTTAASGPSSDGSNPRGTRVKLTDFGIAKLLDAQGVTSTGQVLGSPAHMAPEQIEGGDVGPRADVFALGVMLYECMVGRLPFDGKNPAQVLRRVLEGVYPPADRELPTVGARWAKVLAGALVRDASGRFASIEAFAEAIRAELALVGVRDPRREVDRFLGDPDGYARAFEPTLVEGLVLSGERARKEGAFALAAAQFNRALAYRPGDPLLVRRVSALARRARWLRVGRVAAGASAVVAAAVGGTLWFRSGGSIEPAVKSVIPQAFRPSPRPTASAPPSATAAERPPKAKGAPSGPRKPGPFLTARPRPGAMRAVKVDVTGGIKGGELKVDGEAQSDSWFSEPLNLPVGLHLFEFIPKDPDCCRIAPVSRLIEEGETPVKVAFSVAFNDAELRVTGPSPGTLRCRSLFSQDLGVPGISKIRMSRLFATGDCTFSPEGAALSGPLTKHDVTLTAGQTTAISFP